MKLMPFKDVIGLSKEKLDAAMAPVRAKMVRSKAELEMSKLEADILNKETALQEMFAHKDIDFPKAMDKIDEIALLERRLKLYGDILSQLFPADQPTT